jgi:hypothetical protein
LIQQLEHVLFLVPSIASCSESDGGKDTFCIPLSERVRMHIQNLAHLTECKDFGERFISIAVLIPDLPLITIYYIVFGMRKSTIG